MMGKIGSLRGALTTSLSLAMLVACQGQLLPGGGSEDGDRSPDASVGSDDGPSDSTDDTPTDDSPTDDSPSDDSPSDDSPSDDSPSDDSPSDDSPSDDSPSDDSPSDDSPTDGDDGPPGELVWRQARLTHFTSYPAPGSEECEDFNGCTWAGYFAFVEGKQSENWVMMHNIIAVHEKDADWLGLKNVRLRMDGDEIDVTVYDMCSDSDCNGCCSNNAAETGYLVDIEKYTMERFGHGDGTVEWACLDCD